MHDQWIGIIADKHFNRNIFVNDKLIRYRRHCGNVSKLKHYGLKRMVQNRFKIIKKIIGR